MDRADLLVFLRSTRDWVQSSIHEGGAPQSAVVGVAVTDDLELVFDTLDSTRKSANLRRDPRIAFTMWKGERTAQIEGLADEPRADDLAPLKRAYFSTFPDGPTRESWPGITYVRTRITWIRVTDFSATPPILLDLDQSALSQLA